MANLLSQNIGTNYKSILNLDATTINTPLDATLRAVTDGMGTSSPLQLSTDQVGLIRTVALSAGATNPRLFNEVYTINNSGAQTGTLTGLFLNATETALNGITHNLMDLQVGGASKFSVRNTGQLVVNSTFGISFSNGTNIVASTNGVFTMLNAAGTDFNRLQFGGTTSSFPAIKRNGAAIDFRLADDSGYATLNCGNISAISGGTIGGNGGAALGVTYGGSVVGISSFYGFSSTTVPSGTMDSNISRISAGLVGIGTGTTSNVLGGISLSRLIAAGLPTTRPATVGEFYQDTAANILANGDKVVGIRQ